MNYLWVSLAVLVLVSAVAYVGAWIGHWPQRLKAKNEFGTQFVTRLYRPALLALAKEERVWWGDARKNNARSKAKGRFGTILETYNRLRLGSNCAALWAVRKVHEEVRETFGLEIRFPSFPRRHLNKLTGARVLFKFEEARETQIKVRRLPAT